MSTMDLMQPTMETVNRSQLRQNQSALLKRAKGRAVLLVKAKGEEERVVLDKEYFDQLRKELGNLAETLQIAMDRKLFNQILAAAETLDEDLRLGKLHSLEDAFPED